MPDTTNATQVPTITIFDEFLRFEFNINVSKAENIYGLYVGGLLLLLYCLCLFVAYLHVRQDPIVFPLSRPRSGQQFEEYFILIKTSLIPGSSFDFRVGRVIAQLKGSFADSALLHLRKSKRQEFSFARGGINIFVYHSPDHLGAIEEISLQLINDAPEEISYIGWRPCYVSVMKPATREQWGCRIKERLFSYNIAETNFVCKPKLRDKNGLLKSLCLHHPWMSMLHWCSRVGMYNNFINVLIFFFSPIVVMQLVMIVKLYIINGQLSELGKKVLENDIYWKVMIVSGCLLVEIFLEAFFRNTVPKFCCKKHSQYQGLLDNPVSQLGLQDFILDYDWDKVKPLIPPRSVTLTYGLRHGSAQGIFPIRVPQSMDNLWGGLSLDQQREQNPFLRSILLMDQALPNSVRWVANEARGIKEDMMIYQFTMNYKTHICFFCCWLQEWPDHFFKEPDQIGLILSHIMCKDLLILSKMGIERRHRLAQICFHQWHGLFCGLMLLITEQTLQKNEGSAPKIRSFIRSTVNYYGVRSDKDIQTTWTARKQNLKSAKLCVVFQDNVNASAQEDAVRISENNSSWYDKILPFRNTPSASKDSIVSPGPITYESFSDVSYDEDEMSFEDIMLRDPSREAFNMNINWNALTADSEPPPEGDQNKIPWHKTDSVASDDAGSSVKSVTKEAAEPPAQVPKEQPPADAPEKVEESAKTEKRVTIMEPVNPEETGVLDEQLKLLEMENAGEDAELGFLIDKKRMVLPLSDIEKCKVGKPFKKKLLPKPDPANPHMHYRHISENDAYNCRSRKCEAYSQVHKMVGHCALEVLKSVLTKLLHHAMDSSSSSKPTRDKLWLRKKMIMGIYKTMYKKANVYEDSFFASKPNKESNGFNCNRLMTSCYTTLQVLLEVMEDKWKESAEANPHTEITFKKCLFCGRKAKIQSAQPVAACQKMEKLVKFFAKDTIVVAEKEINLELLTKWSMQNYCASVMNTAKKELLRELEDPPLVLASKVTCGMIYTVLHEMTPKHTEQVKELTAEDLRRMGTRRQRIKARQDSREKKKESDAEKRRKAIIQMLVDEFQNQWRINDKENQLTYCAHLLAQCLVQERILGFSVYSGFISKEHEILLDSRRERLAEVENIAYTIIMEVARRLINPQVLIVLESAKDIDLDVMFLKQSNEAVYINEAMRVMQVLMEPILLKVCCKEIDFLVKEKVEDFFEFMLHMKEIDPRYALTQDLVLSKLKAEKNKVYLMPGLYNKMVTMKHTNIGSPVLRWGPKAMEGEESVPEEYKLQPSSVDFDGLHQKVMAYGSNNPKYGPMVFKLLRTRRIINSHVQATQNAYNKLLHRYAAKLQARLNDQVAAATQNITEAIIFETDYQLEYQRDDLYNVEFYSTNNMRCRFRTQLGVLVGLLVFVFTLCSMTYTCVKASSLSVQLLKVCAQHMAMGLAFYGFVFQPLKCFFYSIISLYVV